GILITGMLKVTHHMFWQMDQAMQKRLDARAQLALAVRQSLRVTSPAPRILRENHGSATSAVASAGTAEVSEPLYASANGAPSATPGTGLARGSSPTWPLTPPVLRLPLIDDPLGRLGHESRRRRSAPERTPPLRQMKFPAARPPTRPPGQG